MVSTQTESKPKEGVRQRPEDFEIGGILGEGAYAKVYKSKHKNSDATFAIKVVDKEFVKRYDKIPTIANERNVLNLLRGYPGVVSLKYTFQDSYSLYFVLELAEAGELHDQIQLCKPFQLNKARFYAYEIAKVISHMHQNNVIHRDVKPSNILLTKSGHIKITDFGTAKILQGGEPEVPVDDVSHHSEVAEDDTLSDVEQSHSYSYVDEVVEDDDFDPDAVRRERATSFVGTAQYVPPELLKSQKLTWGSDWWSFGIVLFEMLTGHVPFEGASEYLTFQEILKGELIFPDGFDADAKDLISHLLSLDRNTRWGLYRSKDGEREGTETDILTHPFFQPLLEEMHKENKEVWDLVAPDYIDVFVNKQKNRTLQNRTEPNPNNPNEPNPVDSSINTKDTSTPLTLEDSDDEDHQPTPLQPDSSYSVSHSLEIVRKESINTSTNDNLSLAVGVRLGDESIPSDLFPDKSFSSDSYVSLLDGEDIICMGPVVKSSRWSTKLFAKKRVLILTSKPRLIYIVPSDGKNKKHVLKGEIPWSNQITVEVQDTRKFFIHTPKRSYLIQTEVTPLLQYKFIDDSIDDTTVYVRSRNNNWANQWRYVIEKKLK